MKTVFFFILFGFLSFFLYGQEKMPFEQVTNGDYDNGFIYIEVKSYPNNQKLFDVAKNKINNLPEITKEKINNDIYYSYTGYTSDSSKDIEVINVKIRFTDENNIEELNLLLKNFNLSNDEVLELLGDIDSEEFVASSGVDNYGKFTVLRKLLFDDSDETEEIFKCYYAMIVYLNYNNINKEELSRDLMNYMLMVQ